MANLFGNYGIVRYANAALELLYQRMGIAARIHRGYSPKATEKGQTIKIARPGTFVAQDAPSDPQDLTGGGLEVKLTHWRDVVFAVPDDETQYTPETFITTHIAPAVNALASDVEGNLAGLFKQVPWRVNAGSDQLENILEPQTILAENGVIVDDGMVHFGIANRQYKSFLAEDWVHRADYTNQTGALLTGRITERFGIEMFRHGLLPVHTSGTVISAGNDNAGALVGDHDKGATQISIDGLSGTETLKAGDSFVVAGNTQRYVVTEDATLTAGANTAVKISPALVQDYANDVVVTFPDGSEAGNHQDLFEANPMFHEHAFALATAPLEDGAGSQQAERQGIDMETVTDPETGLTLRAMYFYNPQKKRREVSLDILYGFAVLDPNKAVILCRDAA